MSDLENGTRRPRRAAPDPSNTVNADPDLSRLIADSSGFWEYLIDPRGETVWVSPASEAITGHPAEEFLKNPGLLEEIVHPEDRALLASHRSTSRASGGVGAAYFRIVRRDGAVRWIGHTCKPVFFPGENAFGRRSSNQDITDLKKSEQELLRLNRTLRAISNTNQALMRASDESSFLAEVCRVIVEDCGHAMVWVGFAEEDEAKSVRPVAHAGFDQGYIDSLDITWADSERGRGPTGTAIRTGKPAGCRNMLTDPFFAPWREEALKRGYASSIVLPVVSGGNVFGALNIYSREPDSFSDEERRLLSKLAGDLAYGITSLRSRAAQAEAEKALCESEERYRTLFKSMSEGFVLCELVCDAEGVPADFRALNVNPAFTELTGLSAEQVAGRTIKEVIPGVEPFWIEAFGRVVRTGHAERLEGYMARLGKHFEVFAWRPGAGRFAVVFSDVTERRKAAEQVEWLASFPGLNPLPILEVDLAGRVHYANPTARKLFPDLARPEAPHTWLGEWEPVARAFREGNSRLLGREITVEEHTFDQTLCFFPESGHVRIYGWEITARKRAEEALESARAAAVAEKSRLEAVMEALPVGVAILDQQGGNIRSNDAFEKVWGGPRPPTKSVDDYAAYKAWWADTGRPVQPEEWASAIALREGKAVVGQFLKIERFDGGRAFILNSAAPVFDPEGRVGGCAVATVDITRRKEAETRLRELNESLEERVQERTAEAEDRAVQLWALASKLTQAELQARQRLAGVLHDHLQQVLVAAKFNLDALKGKVAGDDLGSLAGRIDELLDESIAECRSLTIGLSPPVLRESGLAAALGWLARHMQEQQGLRVDLAVAEDWVEPLDADVKTFLFDAVRELLFNVVKHSGILEARIAMERAGGDLRIVVEDHGKGFDREALSDRRWDGAGFGLFSIRQRMELFGGAMSVESAPGRGARVTLRAQLKPDPEAAVPAVEALPELAPEKEPGPRRNSNRSGRIRVVIADDHRILRQGLIALLKVESNIDVVGEASDGIEAIELARALRPDVIVMDVTMPRMNGIEATRQITAELPRIRIIGLSMHEDEAIAASMREAGAVDFVTKGGRSDTLVAAIQAAAGGGFGQSEG